MKLPAMQFYTGDWKKDPCLSLCSPATRGIWVDLLCAMHDDERCGKIVGTCAQLARIGRCNEDEMRFCIDELRRSQTADVTERTGTVTIINRRMSFEHKQREGDRLRQQRKRGTYSSHDDVTEKSRGRPGVSSSPSSSNTGTGVLKSVTSAGLSDDKHFAEILRTMEAESGQAFTERDRLNIAAAWERAREIGKRPVGLFRRLVEKRLWKNISNDQEERARRRLRSIVEAAAYGGRLPRGNGPAEEPDDTASARQREMAKLEAATGPPP